MDVPWWGICIGGATVLYIVIYLFWKVKNRILEWILATIYSLLIVVVISITALPTLLENLEVTQQYASLSGIVALGTPLLSILIKYTLKPLILGLKKTFFLKAE